MADEVASLVVRIQATQERFARDMEKTRRSLDRASRRMEQRARRLDNVLSEVGSRFGFGITSRSGAIIASLAAIGRVASDAVGAGDRFRQFEARFAALTGSAELGAEAFRNVQDTADRMGVGIDTVADAMSRFTLAGDALGATNAEVQKLTETVLALGAIGGGSTQQLEAGAVQLGQALASGRLQGDELRSIFENMTLLAKTLAEELGVGVGELRKMGSEGELTSRMVFDALLRKSTEVREEFERLPGTVSRASARMSNAWDRFAASIDESLGLSRSLVKTYESLAYILDSISGYEPPKVLGGAIASGTGASLLDRARVVDGTTPRPVPGLHIGVKPGAIGDSYRMFADMAGDPGFQALAAARAKEKRGPEKPGDGGGGGRSHAGGGGSVATDAGVIAGLEGMRERIDLLREEIEALDLSADAAVRYRAEREALRFVADQERIASQDGIAVTQEMRAEWERLGALYVETAVSLDAVTRAKERDAEAARDAADATRRQREEMARFGEELLNGVLRANSFSDALQRVALSLAEVAIQGVFRGSGPLGGLLGGVLPSLFAARGAAFGAGGQVQAFARGGVVGAPTMFQHSGGLGVMGERGPEAVMPLSRGPDGKLGVAAGGGAPALTINVDARGSVTGEAGRFAAYFDRQAPRMLADMQRRRRL